MKKFILKYIRAYFLCAVTLISAVGWANIQVPVSITHGATSTTITSTTLSASNTFAKTCPGDVECQNVEWYNDDGLCNTGGAFQNEYGGTYTTWSTGAQTIPTASPTIQYLTIAGTPSPNSLAFLLCPSGTVRCHVCICTNPGETNTNAGACSSPTGTIYPDSCTTAGQPVFNSTPATLTLTCP